MSAQKHFTKNLVKKLKVETNTQHRNQQLKEFIQIENVQVDKQSSPEQKKLSMNPMINSSFKNSHDMGAHLYSPHSSL